MLGMEERGSRRGTGTSLDQGEDEDGGVCERTDVAKNLNTTEISRNKRTKEKLLNLIRRVSE